jgi:hypothetical protein
MMSDAACRAGVVAKGTGQEGASGEKDGGAANDVKR